jgi:hypothetical protein
MAVQTIKAVNWLINPFVVQDTTPVPEWMIGPGEEFDIDDDGWVDYHTDPSVNNAEIVPP